MSAGLIFLLMIFALAKHVYNIVFSQKIGWILQESLSTNTGVSQVGLIFLSVEETSIIRAKQIVFCWKKSDFCVFVEHKYPVGLFMVITV